MYEVEIMALTFIVCSYRAKANAKVIWLTNGYHYFYATIHTEKTERLIRFRFIPLEVLKDFWVLFTFSRRQCS